MVQKIIGYARVSTRGQSLDSQIDALRKAGVEDKYLFEEKMSGRLADRPQLKAALAQLREKDTFIVYSIDRLGRTVSQLVELVEQMSRDNINFISIRNNIDTSTRDGRMFFTIFAALAQNERELLTERTQAGLAAARARGRVGGRPSVVDPQKIKIAEKLLDDGMSVTEVCKQMQLSRTTLYRHIKKLKTGTEIERIEKPKIRKSKNLKEKK